MLEEIYNFIYGSDEPHRVDGEKKKLGRNMWRVAFVCVEIVAKKRILLDHCLRGVVQMMKRLAFLDFKKKYNKRE